MSWKCQDLAEELELFNQGMKLCLDDNKVNDPKKRAIKIRIAIGNEGLRRINSSGLSDSDQDKPEKLWNILEAQLEVKIKFCIHQLEFMRYRQKAGENIDEFVKRCSNKNISCNFEDAELAERMTKLVVSSTLMEANQKHLLDQAQGYSLGSLLNKVIKDEAIVAGKQRVHSGLKRHS